MKKAESIVRLLENAQLPLDNEKTLQAGIAELLEVAGFPHEREVRLSAADRIDFMVGSVGIEVKMDGSTSALVRQLHRYAQHEDIEALVVATTRTRLARLPEALGGASVHSVHLIGSIL